MDITSTAALIFMGRLIRHGGLYPSWNLRASCAGPRPATRERSVPTNTWSAREQPITLHGEMLHVRRETMSYFLDKHIRYADLESDEWIRSRSGQSRTAPLSRAISKDPASLLRIRQWLWTANLAPRTSPTPLAVPLHVPIHAWASSTENRVGIWRLLMACYEYMITMFYRDKLRQARESQAETKKDP